MTKTVSYRITTVNEWNRDRLGEHHLDAITTAYLGDPEITDRDRIAFALRDLGRLGYEVEGEPVDWSKPQLICSTHESPYEAFGEPAPSRLYRRLRRIGERAGLVRLDSDEVESLIGDLYYGRSCQSGGDKLYDADEYAFLREPYVLTFKGDTAVVEAIFQAVGFATRLGLSTPSDGSESHYQVDVATLEMALVKRTPSAVDLGPGSGLDSVLETRKVINLRLS